MPVVYPPADETTIEALTVAVTRFYEPDLPDLGAEYADEGWTAEQFTAVEALARWAVDHQVGLVFDLEENGRKRTHRVRRLTSALHGTTKRAREFGLSFADAFAWAAVEAAVPSATQAAEINEMMYAANQPWSDVTLFPRWLVLGALGPLAWAAGLTIDETESAAAEGADVATLRTLAILRGCALMTAPS